MDDLVKAAMAKWPHVPDCRGWLGLDARGDWYMRDDRTQAAGPFPHPKGSRVVHTQLCAFIGRNYAVDASGQWYFQNGPQRVYVELEAAPWVWRVGPAAALTSHTGLAARHRSAWLDETGRLFLDTDLGFGLVHTLDMALAAEAVEAGTWVCAELPFAQMPARFGFVRSPQMNKPPAGGSSG